MMYDVIHIITCIENIHICKNINYKDIYNE